MILNYLTAFYSLHVYPELHYTYKFKSLVEGNWCFKWRPADAKKSDHDEKKALTEKDQIGRISYGLDILVVIEYAFFHIPVKPLSLSHVSFFHTYRLHYRDISLNYR